MKFQLTMICPQCNNMICIIVEDEQPTTAKCENCGQEIIICGGHKNKQVYSQIGPEETK